MKHAIIEFKPLVVSHYVPSEIKGNYTAIEDIKAVSQGGQELKLRRFVRPDEYFLKVGQVYEGRLKPRPQEHPDYSDTINEVKALNDWDGIEEIGLDAWDTTDPEQEALKKQAHFDAFGDIHTAAPIVAAIRQEKGALFRESIRDLLIETALICRDARLELTEQYYQEKKVNGGKDER